MTGIDLLSPESFAAGHPHGQYEWLREHDPVHWHEEPDGPGFWALTHYSDVRAVGRDPQTFSSEPTTMIHDGAALDLGEHALMLMMDPPRHTRYRLLVSAAFKRTAAARLSTRVAELAAQIVDEVVDRDEFDLVEDVAGLLPSYVIAELLGIPAADGVALYRLTETLHAAPGAVSEADMINAAMEMLGYAHGVWQEKSARPADDLASALVTAEVDGHRLDELDFGLFFLLLIDAGGDTTRNLIAGGMEALFAHPDQRHRLARDLDLLPTAIEELLRWVSPVIYMRRTATRDVDLHGRRIEAGQKVVMYYGAANRDPRAFIDPDRLDLGRTPNGHAAFGGGGAHFCLGAHIARIEIGAMFRELLTRLPDLQPAGEPTWLESNFVSGPKHLPVRRNS